MGEELIEVSRLESAESDLIEARDKISELEATLADVAHERDSAIDRADDAESDVVRWQDRAYEAESMLEDAHIRIVDLEKDYDEACSNYHDLEVEHDRRAYERDCYKEVLKGMEFIEIDSYPEKGAAFCSRLGTEAKETIETVINKALEKR